MSEKIQTTLHTQPLPASPISDQDHEIGILLDDNISPSRRAVQRSNMPMPMQGFGLPLSNDAPGLLPKTNGTGYVEAQPYSANKESLAIPINDNNVQNDRRRPLTKWTKWMNSEWKNHMVAIIGEFIGTTLFLFFGYAGIEVATLQGRASTDIQVLFYIAATFGASLMVNVWIFFRISGGLFNPAVTLALTLLQAVAPVRAILLVIAQLGASCLAAILVERIFPNRFGVATSLGSGTSLGQGFVIETITTAVLIFTIIMLAVEKHRATFIAPIGIGMALFVAHMIAIPLTGASLNPARSFGPAAILGDFGREHWIYWIGPILGAGLAVLFFRLIKLLEYEMANPGQDGDAENDPTQNLELDVAQNVQEREAVVKEAEDAKSWSRDEPSTGSSQTRQSGSSPIESRKSMDQEGGMSGELDDIEAQRQRRKNGNFIQRHFASYSRE